MSQAHPGSPYFVNPASYASGGGCPSKCDYPFKIELVKLLNAGCLFSRTGIAGNLAATITARCLRRISRSPTRRSTGAAANSNERR